MINRYLASNDFTDDILKDLSIKKSRDCLLQAKNKLRLDNLFNADLVIASDQKEELFSSEAFETGNPNSLLAVI